MFCPTDTPNTLAERFHERLATRARDLLQLAIAFLTLEDGYEPDWAATEVDDARPPSCSGRVRLPHPAPVDSPWISA